MVNGAAVDAIHKVKGDYEKLVQLEDTRAQRFTVDHIGMQT